MNSPLDHLVVSEHSARVLGFYEILTRVAGHLKGEASTVLLDSLVLSSTEEELQVEHRRWIEPLFHQAKKGEALPSGRWEDMEPLFHEVFEQGLFLEEWDLLSIGHFVEEGMRVRNQMGKSTQDFGIDLYFWALGLPKLERLSSHLLSFVDESGELKESAIPEMRHLRSSIRQRRQELMRLAASVVRENPTFFQEGDITERDGRVLVPLKANFKGRVQGLIHSISGTGGTLFLEPFGLVERNNEKQGLEDEYHQLRFKVLKDLSARIRTEQAALKLLWTQMGRFDTWRARALYGLVIDGAYLENKGQELALLEARHPLLGEPVPLNLTLPTGKHALIITGPNAGGKTVVLKTIGLFALMNQVGIPLPVSPHSTLPIFDKVFVDIGDSQSISASLSTFSAHMAAVASLQVQATQNSLILLDELGSSTDPEQGLSLAQSLLEDLIARRSLVAVSTHFSYLKYLGYTQEGAVNVSLNINEETLLPTYQVRMGVPGESFAFVVARRQGLAAGVLSRAESLYQSNETEQRSFMEKLRSREYELSLKTQALDAELLAVGERAELLQHKESRLQELERDLLECELREESTFLREARRTLETLQKRLCETAGIKEEWHQSKAHVNQWEENLAKKRRALSKLEESQKAPVEFVEGMSVQLKRQGSRGVLLRRDRKDNWQVQVGSFKLLVAEKDLEPISSVSALKKGKPKRLTYYEIDIAAIEERAQFVLDIRGLRLEEALKVLQSQLDRALVQGLTKFAVIHGTGNGILQMGVHEALAAHPYVASFYLAEVNEGGAGKTWVEFKA